MAALVQTDVKRLLGYSTIAHAGYVMVKEAIAADDKNRVLFELGRDYSVYAVILKRKGDRSKAKENLSKSIEIFK